VPVVDGNDRPVGIISQGDLIYKAGMPMRLGLLAESNGDRLAAVLTALSGKKAEDAMTRPAVAIGEERLATEAVDLMIEKEVKRLPVVNGDGRLVGMLSRLDIFRTIMQEAPDWQSFRQQRIEVGNLHLVADIMRRDTQTVQPETSVEEVIRIIDANDIQRVAVVDRDGRFCGLISDRDLLVTFAPAHQEGIWSYFASRVPFTERGRKYREFRELLQARTAAQVMNTNIVTAEEDSTIDEAMRLMTEKGIKRLPVLDGQGKFKGMVSRDSLLRTGFGHGG
jgi:CBS domain-containing protein